MSSSADLDVIRLDVALYFQRNPFARETASSLSTRVGRSSELVGPVLERLVEQQILQRRGTGEGALYRYNQPYLFQAGR